MSGTRAPFASTVSVVDLRALLLGGTLSSVEILGACLRVRGLREGDSASSSPEASREDGCWRSVADDFNRSDAVVRFRLADPFEDGEDMADGLGYRQLEISAYSWV
jgi:hypothetical protein